MKYDAFQINKSNYTSEDIKFILCIININCIGLLNLNYKHTQINEIIINYYWTNALQWICVFNLNAKLIYLRTRIL